MLVSREARDHRVVTIATGEYFIVGEETGGGSLCPLNDQRQFSKYKHHDLP